MRRLLFALLICGCTCGAPSDPPSAAPTSSAAPSASPTEAPTAPPTTPRADAPEPHAPSPSETRAWLTRLREARRLAHDSHPAEAYAIFEALVRERPAVRTLRCEAGFVAFRAERLDDAEHQITDALDGWPSPPPARERVPLAMCLYNRGLVAEARGDHTAAAEAWRRSLELRPNTTVAARLAALDVPAPSADATSDDGHDDHDPYADGVYSYDEWLEETRADMSDGTSSEELQRIAGPTPGRSLVIVSFTTPADEESFESTDLRAVLVTETNALEIASVSYETINSWYDDHASLEQRGFFAGPPELGQLVAVTTDQWSRGDSEDGAGDETSYDSRLTMCAERLDWACVSLPYRSTTTLDCESVGGCRGEPDEFADEGDDDDGEDDAEEGDDERPEYHSRGFQQTWSIDGGTLVLTDDPDFHPTDPEEPSYRGRVPIVDLLSGT